MSARAPLASMWHALDARGKRLAWAFGAAHFAERLALFAVALAAPAEDRTLVAVAAAALGVLTLGRAFVGSVAQAHAQALLHVRVGESLLARDLLRPTALEDDDPEAALLDGIDVGARVAAGTLPGTVADAIAAVVVAVVLVRTTPGPLFVAFAAAVALGGVALALFRRVTVTASEQAWAAQRPLVDRLVAILSGRLELVANGADGAMRASLEGAARAWQGTVGRFERTTAITSRLPLLFGAGLLAAVFLFRTGGSLRELALAAVALAAAVPPFAGAARGLHDLGKLGVRVAPLASLLVPPAAAESAHARAAAPAPRTMAFDGVAFRYAEAASDVLKSATCELARGTITVLAGPNGCGKSTFLKLLLAIEPPREGRFLVDGALMHASAVDAPAAALRAHVAYLPQRPFLPERATVREAFALLVPAFDEAKALAWLERVGMHDVLRAKSAHDPLAVRVGKLSAGQRQRLAIARVGLLDRAVWLLDEPDASLDADGLARLESILDEERPRRLIVVAAHADALLRTADRVLRIERGKLSDELRPSGTFP